MLSSFCSGTSLSDFRICNMIGSLPWKFLCFIRTILWTKMKVMGFAKIEMFIEIVHQNLSLVMNEIRYGCSVKTLDTYFTLQLKFFIFECESNQNTSPLSSCFALYCLSPNKWSIPDLNCCI